MTLMLLYLYDFWNKQVLKIEKKKKNSFANSAEI